MKPLERAEQDLREIYEQMMEIIHPDVLDRLIRAVRKHDAELIRAHTAEMDLTFMLPIKNARLETADIIDPDKQLGETHGL